MRKNLLILISIIGCGLSSCSQKKKEYFPPNFPIEKKINSTRLSSESMMLIYPYDMCMDSTYIYVLSLVDNTWIQVYDRQNGNYIGGYIQQGQGPGEIITGTQLSYNENKHIISIFDQSSRKLLSYQAGKTENGLLSFISEKSFYDEKKTVRNAWELSSDKYLIDGQIGSPTQKQKRFQLLHNNLVTNEYNHFPVDSSEEQMIFLSSAASVSPNCKKMVFGTLFGGILEIFDLSNEIERTAIRPFYRPVVHFESGAIKGTPETVYGFSAMYATNNQIYSVLIGNKDPNTFNNISVFDWEGNEIIKYHTDCLVFKLFVPIDEPNRIYTIAFSNEEGFYLVYFDI